MPELDVQVEAHGEGALRLRVRVKPRAAKSRVLGVREGALEVAVAAVPAEGAANAELIATLADHFEIPKSRLSIVSGGASRSKLVRLAGLSRAQLLEKVGA